MVNSKSFISSRNNPTEKLRHQKTEPNLLKISNKNNIEKTPKSDLMKSKLLLKDILNNKSKLGKIKKTDNLRRNNSSLSFTKVDTKKFGMKNKNNQIFINIISKNPFIEEIKEEENVTEIPKKKLKKN